MTVIDKHVIRHDCIAIPTNIFLVHQSGVHVFLSLYVLVWGIFVIMIMMMAEILSL